MSEAVFVRLAAHLNIEGLHESLCVCNFFKLGTEIAFFAFNLTVLRLQSRSQGEEKEQGWIFSKPPQWQFCTQSKIIHSAY